MFKIMLGRCIFLFDTKLCFCHSQVISQFSERIRRCHWYYKQNELACRDRAPLIQSVNNIVRWTLRTLTVAANLFYHEHYPISFPGCSPTFSLSGGGVAESLGGWEIIMGKSLT